jgi:hypothetical protein
MTLGINTRFRAEATLEGQERQEKVLRLLGRHRLQIEQCDHIRAFSASRNCADVGYCQGFELRLEISIYSEMSRWFYV